MSAREEILRALRSARFDVPLPAVPAPVPSTGVVERFVERAAAAGVDVVRASASTFAPVVIQSLRALQVRSAVVSEDGLLEPLAAALRAEGITIPGDAARSGAAGSGAAGADAGITTADFAIAETGTLVLGASPGHPRGTSLLPPRHLVVLPEDRIVATLFDLIPRLRSLPSALTFITGPSRTADIELTPVRGAHGPIAVQVFLLTL